MMSASMQGAMAFQKGLGCVHSLSHSLGGVNPRLHHGTLNAMFLPAVVRFNARTASIQAEQRLQRMAQAMGLPAATPRAPSGRGHPRDERPPGPAQRPARHGRDRGPVRARDRRRHGRPLPQDQPAHRHARRLPALACFSSSSMRTILMPPPVDPAQVAKQPSRIISSGANTGQAP
jgi:hypothetical protein